MKINKRAITDIELDYNFVMSDFEQRELLIWFWKEKPEMIRDIVCEGCPEVSSQRFHDG
jgi:hypothetical protein